MARSMLAAVREATLANAADPVREEDTTNDAPASSTQETEMSTEPKPAGGASKDAGIAQADHDAAVKAAREEGRAEGAKGATDRLVAALGAEGIRGSAARMGAALDLAQRSPGMDGAAIAEFIKANVAAENAGASAYEQERAAAAGLAQPGKPKPQGGEAIASMWDKAVGKINGQN